MVRQKHKEGASGTEVTNPTRVRKALDCKACNALLLKAGPGLSRGWAPRRSVLVFVSLLEGMYSKKLSRRKR